TRRSSDLHLFFFLVCSLPAFFPHDLKRFFLWDSFRLQCFVVSDRRQQLLFQMLFHRFASPVTHLLQKVLIDRFCFLKQFPALFASKCRHTVFFQKGESCLTDSHRFFPLLFF